MQPKASSSSREPWLDGLRGIAAMVVVNFHLTAEELDIPYRSFWEQDNAHRSVVQLPPFRILLAGQAMVQLFFVISGYSLTLSIGRGKEDATTSRKIRSAVFRRGLRLYFPVLVCSAISHVLWFCGMYTWNVLESTCPSATPWSSPWSHLECFVVYILDVANCIQPQLAQLNSGLNIALWSIPFELRGSLVVYLVLMALIPIARWRRVTILSMICMFNFWHGTTDVFPFLAGLLLVEWREQGLAARRLSFSVHQDDALSQQKRRIHARFSDVGRMLLLFAGVYILSLPVDEYKFTSDWRWREKIRSPAWRDIETEQKCWFSVAAILCVAALQGIPHARKVLETRPVQFLGRLSFAIYLVHIPVIHILRSRLLDAACWIMERRSYNDVARSSGSHTSFAMTWIITGAVSWAVLILIAEYGAEPLDRKSIEWARRIENSLSESRM